MRQARSTMARKCARLSFLALGMYQRSSLVKNTNIVSLTTLSCSAGWRNYYFVKLVTDEGVVGWSEFDEGFGSPGVAAVIEQLPTRDWSVGYAT